MGLEPCPFDRTRLYIQNHAERLSEDDLRTITGKKMLTDAAIHHFQKILQRQSPFAIGLQDPVIGQRFQFRVISSDPFVQILHDGGLHWVTISTYNCHQYGEINYFDSLYHHRIKKHIKKQIAAIVRCDKDELVINVKPVQQQTNSVDCGIFAIAFALDILKGKDPTQLRLCSKMMRSFLHECYTKGVLLDFPSTTKQPNIAPVVDKKIGVKLFCTCRMPYFEGDVTADFKNRMIECERCSEWFHQDCENVLDEFYESESSSWICRKCSV